MKRLLLHIGTGKTGTSSIQNFLFANRGRLAAEFGVCYPETGLSHVHHFGNIIHAHYPLVPWLVENDRGNLNALIDEFEKSGGQLLVISCENLYHHLKAADIALLAEMFSGFSVQVLCYVRRQDLFMESAWKQQVKVGSMKIPFQDFLKWHTTPEYLDKVHANYYRMLKPWAETFGIDAVRVKAFDKSEWVNGDLIDDFLATCLSDKPVSDFSSLIRPGDANSALPSELICLLQKTNALGIVAQNEQQKFVASLEKLALFKNPPLLSKIDRVKIIKNYAAANRALFSEFLNRKTPPCFSIESIGDSEKIASLTPASLENIAINALVGLWQQSRLADQQQSQLENQQTLDSDPLGEKVIKKTSYKNIVQLKLSSFLSKKDKAKNQNQDQDQWPEKNLTFAICESLSKPLTEKKEIDLAEVLPELKSTLKRLGKILLQPLENELSKDKAIAGCWFLGNGTYNAQVQMEGARLPDILKRFFPLMLYFEELARSFPKAQGFVPIFLADQPRIDVPMLAFCSNNPSHRLVPDSYFIQSNGYKNYKKEIDTAWIPWEERAAIAYWRGSSTGNKNSEAQWRQMPRFQLCALSHNCDLIDAKIGQLTGFKDPEIIKEIESHGYVAQRAPNRSELGYRYLIDIDGFSNSFPGLFKRLLTGSPVLKVDSVHHYKQWYYDRLIPWQNYIPIKADLSDLEEIVNCLIKNDQEAKRIGEEGRKLALSIDFKAEIKNAVTELQNMLKL